MRVTCFSAGPLIALAVVVSVGATTAPKPDRRLVEAVKSGNSHAIAALLKQRVDVNVAEADGTTALHWAVRHDDLRLATSLLRAGATVKATNRYGVTPLYLACLNGSAPMLEALVKAGAEVNAPGPEGETALMTVARTGNVDAADVLLARGATVDARETWRGQTALMWASAQGHPAMMRLLLRHGEDANARSTVVTWERQRTLEPREKWLPPGGMTPLLFAARQGCLDCARVLVEAGAAVNTADPDSITPMLSAIINGHYDVAAFLLEKGADPNLADVTGRTPLYAAVDFNTMPQSNRPAPKVIHNQVSSLDLIASLLGRGANPNARLKRQQPYRTKLDRGNDTMFGAGTTPIIRAAKAGDVAAMKLLLKHGADAKLTTGAEGEGDASVGTGANANRRGGGVNALMAAAGVGTREEDATGRLKTEADAIETIKLCLEAGLDVNAADANGRTALHGAALFGYDKVIRFLAEHGARIDVKDKRGFTPLDMAAGKAGGVGFDGRASNPHPSTEALLKELIGAKVGG